ncbi:hypothetical protein [Pseudomonas sp. UMAB-40]|uniref:hypothetical protein n=1 Tax=Pseudomonas sp. UMAB-40 TaxID=1365407 RepID=UPI001C577E74|nr:hypothetical protein [Pseudomonas sp. UMAB-40]
MNNEPIEGMVVTADGRNAVMVDTKNGHYGWVFFKHPDGMWVSSRKASTAELSAAEHHYNSLAAFRKVFGGLVKPVCQACGDDGYLAVPQTPGIDCPDCTPAPDDASADVQADHNRLVRELDVLLNGEAGAADQASLCDIVAQVRLARKKPGTGALQLLALVPDQVVGRVHRIDGVADYPAPIYGVLNSTGRALPDNAPLYARPADTLMRYVRAPSRKDPKYHEEWPEIEGGPVFDGVTYCNDLFEALKRYNVIVAETMPEGGLDE